MTWIHRHRIGKGRRCRVTMGEGCATPIRRRFRWRNGSPPTWLALCGALTVQVGFGLYPVVVKKFAFQAKTNPYVFTFYRGIGATIVLMSFSFVFERHFALPKPRMVAVFMLLGVVGIFLNQFFYITAVYSVGPDATSALQPMTAVFTPVIAVLICSEKFSLSMPHTWLKFAGVLLAVGGAVEVALTGRPEDELATGSGSGLEYGLMASGNETSLQGLHWHQQALGYLCSMLDSFCSAISIVLQKRWIYSKADCVWRAYPIAVTGYSFLFGSMYMGLFNLYYVASRQSQEFALPLTSLYALVYAIFITSALCYFFINWSNKHLSSSVVAAFWPVQILLTLVASFLLFGDLFAPWQYLGSCVLLFGLMLVLYASRIDERLAKEGNHPRGGWCRERGSHKLSSHLAPTQEGESFEMHTQTGQLVESSETKHRSSSKKSVSTEDKFTTTKSSADCSTTQESYSHSDSDDGDDRTSESQPLMPAETGAQHRTTTTSLQHS